MKTSIRPVVVLCGLTAPYAVADESTDHHYLEEIIVSVPFQQPEADTALPVNILTGEDLQKAVASSIGATLRDELGVHNASFGTGVGQPIIRGQTGNRVQVLQNSLSNVDASAVSPDHANGVEPVLASRIEVIRGPATLLYGNGAIGGVVNVLDDGIAESALEKPEFVIEQSHDSVSDEDKTVAKLNATLGAVTFHASGFTRDNDDIEVSGFAIDEQALEALEHDHHDEHEDDHDDEHDEDHEHEEAFVNTRGFIGNSDAESEGFTFGAALTGERGFIGISVSQLDSNYGLPPGSHDHDHGDEHDHEDEDHDEEHGENDHDDDDHHDEDDHGNEGHEHEEGEGFVRLNMEQTRYNLRGELSFNDQFIESIRGSLSYTDYEHQEIEFEGDGTVFLGTEFRNEGVEGRVTMVHAPVAGWNGIWGLQFGSSEFSAIGSEAFIPETDTDSLALFAVERFDAENMTWELGLRHERLDLDPGGSCDTDESTTSISGSVLYDLSELSNLMLAVSRSERAPTLEERYSNVQSGGCQPSADPEDWVVHAATGLLEIGNPDLDKEVATNIEIGYHTHTDLMTLEINAYYNQITDYIYLADGGEFEEQPIARYTAEDADFWGVEARLDYRLLRTEYGELDVNVSGDFVRAEFDDAGDVPRIPPARLGAGIGWHSAQWSVEMQVTKVFDQDDAGVGEFETDGYTRLSLYTDYHLSVGGGDLVLFAKGTNLLDEEIRNHASFLKNYAPEPGRGVRIGLRYHY